MCCSLVVCNTHCICNICCLYAVKPCWIILPLFNIHHRVNISCTVVRNFCAESESKGATVDHSDSKNIEGMLSCVSLSA